MVLHERGLVHGADPAVHVLLRVGAEEVGPHAAVLGLRANHRALTVDVRAHARVAGLRGRENGRQPGAELTPVGGQTMLKHQALASGGYA